MNDLQRLNLMMARGAKLDDIISAIVAKGGTVADPKKVAEIVAAINAVASWDADIIASNILMGKDIFGVAGNVQPKVFASGTVTSPPTPYYFTQYNGNPWQCYIVTVSGLTFIPTKIVVTSPLYPIATVYDANSIGGSISGHIATVYAGISETGYGHVIKLTGNAYVGTTFQLPVEAGNQSYNWYAWQ